MYILSRIGGRSVASLPGLVRFTDVMPSETQKIYLALIVIENWYIARLTRVRIAQIS